MNHRQNVLSVQQGMSADAFMDRRDFLQRTEGDLIRLMLQSGISKPVGVVADVRDFHERQFAIAIGLAEVDIDALIAKHEGKLIPTVKAVLTWEQARKIMPLTSPTANESLNATWRLAVSQAKPWQSQSWGRATPIPWSAWPEPQPKRWVCPGPLPND